MEILPRIQRIIWKKRGNNILRDTKGKMKVKNISIERRMS